ncbi:MAG: DUF4349 domain-containing protein [Bacteroidia bacterium]|nr:DUF4349 domain-containing protein [Bacteroidia bacterium]
MKKLISLCGLLLIVATFSCNSDQKSQRVTTLSDMRDNIPPPPPPAAMEASVKYIAPVVVDEDKSVEAEIPVKEGKIQPVNKKKIIKDGNISIKTKDLIAGKKSIDEIVKNLNSYYTTEEFENNDQRISYNLRIRIPADNFEKLIASIENGKNEIVSKSIQARDVTEEFIDIETRLNNKRDYLKKYKELLIKAITVKDILAIEENIRILQEEIESKEGRLKYLNDEVTYSTLALYLFKEKEFIYKPTEQDKFSERVKNSLGDGWNFIVGLTLWIISLWPIIILVFILIYAIKKFRKRRKNRQENK